MELQETFLFHQVNVAQVCIIGQFQNVHSSPDPDPLLKPVGRRMSVMPLFPLLFSLEQAASNEKLWHGSSVIQNGATIAVRFIAKKEQPNRSVSLHFWSGYFV